MKLDYERERHRRMVFEENDGGVNDQKATINTKGLDVYMNKK